MVDRLSSILLAERHVILRYNFSEYDKKNKQKNYTYSLWFDQDILLDVSENGLLLKWFMYILVWKFFSVVLWIIFHFLEIEEPFFAPNLIFKVTSYLFICAAQMYSAFRNTWIIYKMTIHLPLLIKYLHLWKYLVRLNLCDKCVCLFIIFCFCVFSSFAFGGIRWGTLLLCTVGQWWEKILTSLSKFVFCAHRPKSFMVFYSAISVWMSHWLSL